MKKAIILAVCLIMAGMLAVNGTFAGEFGDTLTEVVNGVFAVLDELFTGDFAKPYEGGGFDVELVYLDASGNRLTDTAAAPQLLPGRTVERRVAVANESTATSGSDNSAYFRIAFAVQQDVAHLLDFTVNQTNYTWTRYDAPIKIGNTDYLLMVATYQTELPAGSVSAAALQSVALDMNTSNEDIDRFRQDFLQIQVLAIKADDFVDSEGKPMSAEEALNYAIPLANLNPFQ